MQLLSASAHADMESPAPTPTLDGTGILQSNGKFLDNSQTYHMLDTQNRSMESGFRGALDVQDSLVTGQQRAQQMTDLLKNQELQKVFGSLNDRGKQMLQENPEMKNPATIVAGAAALWVGRTIQLFKAESFKLSSRFEARTRTGEFSMESPLMNGKLNFTETNGLSMTMNRKIGSTDTRAEMTYNASYQVFTGQLVHPLTPHFSLLFGASQLGQTNQTDQRATIQYNLSF